jgi:hypothetical protein
MRTRPPQPGDIWTDDDARYLLDEWRRSGDTLAAFARKHGFAPSRLYWWKKKVEPSPRSVPLSLVPATIVSESGVRLTIRLPGEVTIEVADASPNLVAAIVAKLTRSAT